MRISKIVAAICLFASFPVYADLTDGLVAHWTFDEPNGNTVYDSAGTNNGTLQGSTSRVAGRIGDYALNFNNQKYDYVRGSNSPFGFENTTFTVCAWFNTSSHIIVASEGGYLHGGWILSVQDGKIHTETREGSINAYDAYYAWSAGTQIYNDGAWHQVIAIFTTSTTSANGNSSKVYVDGLQIDLDEHKVYRYSPSSDNWTIGGWGGGGFLLANHRGMLDDVRIYNRALTDEEVMNLYLEAFPIPVPVDIKPANCPNPLNLASRGVLSVAILGSADFDVNSIDIASIRLAGVAPVRSSFEDVAASVNDTNECACTDAGPDGFTDLVLKFKTTEIARQIIQAVSEPEKKEIISLPLEGSLLNGRPIKGSDCVTIVGNIPAELLAAAADLDKNGIVDINDLALISQYWLEEAYIE